MDEHSLQHTKELVKHIVDHFGKELVAIAIVGAAARGEETFVGNKMISDVDILLITKKLNPFLEQRVQNFVNQASRDIGFEVEAGFVPLKHLKRDKDLELYEAKESGKVVWGDKKILRQVPIVCAQEIPKWEGIRLLLNRAINLLLALCGKMNSTYAVAKVYLAIGEAYLIFDRRYRSSYKARLDEILANCDLQIIDGFVEKFERCSRFKLNESQGIGLTLEQARVDLLKAISFFLRLFTGQNSPLNENMEVLSKKFYRPSDAAAFAFRKLSKRKIALRALIREPCFLIWIVAIEMLERKSLDVERIEEILEDWHATPQFVLRVGE